MMPPSSRTGDGSEPSLAGNGRNQPCACGSGRKTKRCCGTVGGPSSDQLARAWLQQQAREWALLLVDCTEADLDDLRDEISDLPRRDVSLQVPLPRLLSPALELLRRAVVSGDPADGLATTLAAAVPELDTPSLRARLARAVLALHDDGHRVDCEVAAYAIIDLADEPRSVLLLSSIHQAMAVSAGAARTPSGLLLASR